jgi:hypothetical protein
MQQIFIVIILHDLPFTTTNASFWRFTMLLGSDDGASMGDLSEDDIDKSRSSNRNHGSSDDGNATEDEIDGLLSRELMQTSLIDRNSIFEEIHGVRCLAVEETPELIQKSLQEFQKELDKDQESSRSSSEAYRILLVRKRERQSRPSSNTTNFNTDHNKKQYHGDPDYNYAIDDEDFRLRFLRCELFDVPSAVKRFYNYLSLVHDYWGSVALDRPIRITDFTKSELKVFRMGFYQLLPFRDSSGRRMMVVLGGMKVHEDPSARVCTFSQTDCFRFYQKKNDSMSQNFISCFLYIYFRTKFCFISWTL